MTSTDHGNDDSTDSTDRPTDRTALPADGNDHGTVRSADAAAPDGDGTQFSTGALFDPPADQRRAIVDGIDYGPGAGATRVLDDHSDACARGGVSDRHAGGGFDPRTILECCGYWDADPARGTEPAACPEGER